MRVLILCAFLLAGCGSSSSSPSAPAPGPYADIAGHYLATLVSGDGVYAGLAPGATSVVTIDDTGHEYANAGMSLTGYAGYTLHRQDDGTFLTDSRHVSSGIGTGVWEIGAQPASLATLTLTATEFFSGGSAPAGTVVYTLVKMSGG